MHVAARALYAAAITAGLVPAILRKVAREGFPALHVAERLARAELPASRPVWINAASVGELGAATILVNHLRESLPDLDVFLTHSSEGARARAPASLGVPAHALPLDYAGVMARFLDQLRPRLVLLVEQEVWPNLLLAAQARDIPVAVINGRLSAATTRRHARFKKVTQGLFASLDVVAAQTRADARRFAWLGAPRTLACGNLKFDALPDAAKVKAGQERREAWRARWPGRKILLLASTRPAQGTGCGEEESVINALRPHLDGLIVMCAPRHPDRSAAIAAMLGKAGLACSILSATGTAVPQHPLIIADALGEMDSHYATADLAFIGATLVPLGGQNMMEAFVQGKPVVAGPHTRNFHDLMHAAVREGAARQAGDAAGVATAIMGLVEDDASLTAMGEAARSLSLDWRGATQRNVAALWPTLCRAGLVPAGLVDCYNPG